MHLESFTGRETKVQFGVALYMYYMYQMTVLRTVQSLIKVTAYGNVKCMSITFVVYTKSSCFIWSWHANYMKLQSIWKTVSSNLCKSCLPKLQLLFHEQWRTWINSCVFGAMEFLSQVLQFLRSSHHTPFPWAAGVKWSLWCLWIYSMWTKEKSERYLIIRAQVVTKWVLKPFSSYLQATLFWWHNSGVFF